MGFITVQMTAKNLTRISFVNYECQPRVERSVKTLQFCLFFCDFWKYLRVFTN